MCTPIPSWLPGLPKSTHLLAQCLNLPLVHCSAAVHRSLLRGVHYWPCCAQECYRKSDPYLEGYSLVFQVEIGGLDDNVNNGVRS